MVDLGSAHGNILQRAEFFGFRPCTWLWRSWVTPDKVEMCRNGYVFLKTTEAVGIVIFLTLF